MLKLSGFSYSYPGAAEYALRDVDLAVGPGECHVVTGPTGSGKSTLALALKGLLPEGRSGGVLGLSGKITCGIVMQDPQTQILRDTVGAEAAFGLENLCVPPDDMGLLVGDALSSVGLDKPLDFGCSLLSMGQKYRLLLASQLAMGHRLLIMDEPSGQVDPDGLAMLSGVMRRLKRSGVSFVVFEHDASGFMDVADMYWKVEGGRLARCLPPEAPSVTPVREAGMRCGNGETVITATGLSVAGKDGVPVWSGLDFSVSRGELVSVCGTNGSGKSTLLRLLTGFMRPASGELVVLGEAPSTRRLSGRVGCLLQDPHAQLFEDTVYDEVAFTPRKLGRRGVELRSMVDDALELCGISGLASNSPHTLSYGQKRLVALASVIAHSPGLLLFDDPFSGLDHSRRRGMYRLFEHLTSERGASVLWTTHNPAAVGGAVDQRLLVKDGKVTRHSN
jgi:energy-coupling factor transport system ATP-binding protein